MSTTVLALAVLGLAPADPTIGSYVQSGFKDAAFSAKVQSANQKELAKINQDFAKSYRFKSSNIWLKEPMKLRMESRVEDTDIFFIVNGGKKLVRVPRANINQRDDVSKSPGKRQTPLDFGLLTPSLFNNFFQAKYVRTESSGDYKGDAVFDLTYVPSLDDSSRHRIWVDQKTKYTEKREWYSQQGYLMAVFTYDQPKLFGSVYIPTKMTVKNADGKTGGSTLYTSVKVNIGMDDDLFKVD